MISNNYSPQPIDTSEINIPEDLLPLMEQIARNVHEVWAKGRIDNGWTYGAERNDAEKKHPCLVDYDELPESEKVYDRNTARETLCLILKLGWKLEK
ncbi:MAG: Ryanodine receptor Ryr [Bacteroidales bacterium]|nr:Ryanodine receptor Ryr [Bacteroidales bacterium]